MYFFSYNFCVSATCAAHQTGFTSEHGSFCALHSLIMSFLFCYIMKFVCHLTGFLDIDICLQQFIMFFTFSYNKSYSFIGQKATSKLITFVNKYGRNNHPLHPPPLKLSMPKHNEILFFGFLKLLFVWFQIGVSLSLYSPLTA